MREATISRDKFNETCFSEAYMIGNSCLSDKYGSSYDYEGLDK